MLQQAQRGNKVMGWPLTLAEGKERDVVVQIESQRDPETRAIVALKVIIAMPALKDAKGRIDLVPDNNSCKIRINVNGVGSWSKTLPPNFSCKSAELYPLTDNKWELKW